MCLKRKLFKNGRNNFLIQIRPCTWNLEVLVGPWQPYKTKQKIYQEDQWSNLSNSHVNSLIINKKLKINLKMKTWIIEPFLQIITHCHGLWICDLWSLNFGFWTLYYTKLGLASWKFRNYTLLCNSHPLWLIHCTWGVVAQH
jgi:hypothetical protein